MNTFELMDFILEVTSGIDLLEKERDDVYFYKDKKSFRVHFKSPICMDIGVDNDIVIIQLYRSISGVIIPSIILDGYKWSDIKQNKGNIEYLISNPDMKYLFDGDMWSDNLKKDIEQLVEKG